MFIKGDNIEMKIEEINHNHISVFGESHIKEGRLYMNEMPKVTIECLILNEQEDKLILLTEEINGKDVTVLPGGTANPEESSGQTACRIIKDYTGYEIDSGDLQLYDFRSNPDRDERQWLMSVIYIAKVEDIKEPEMWAKIDEILQLEDSFGYDHHRIIQNFKYNC